MDAITANGPEDEVLDWDRVDWGQVEHDVRRLRQRIFTASQAGDLKRVRNLQKLMLRSRANALLSVRRVTEVNAGRKTVAMSVTNSGDRPIQVGSHYHFFETNPALKFDRKKARGMRLDIAAGTAVRFEPGQTRDVTLVALAGKRTVYGFRQDVMGKL